MRLNNLWTMDCRPWTKKGFTLVEVIIVMAILSIFITSLFTVFKNSIDACKKSETRLEIYQNARAVLDTMSREIPMAMFDPAAGIHVKGYEAGSGIKPDSTGDEFYFIAPLNPGEEDNKSDLCEAGYWLDETNNVLKKFYVTDDRIEDPSDPEFDYDFTTPTGKSNSYNLGLNVMDLNFTFHYRDSGGNWQETADATWDSAANSVGNYDVNDNAKNPDGLPNAVGIEITIKDPNVKDEDVEPKDEYTFSTLVYMPQAK